MENCLRNRSNGEGYSGDASSFKDYVKEDGLSNPHIHYTTTSLYYTISNSKVPFSTSTLQVFILGLPMMISTSFLRFSATSNTAPPDTLTP